MTRLYENFPNELDGARVLLYAVLENPETLYYTDGSVWCEIYYYAVCKYEKYKYFYLFECTKDFSVEADSAWESIEECKNEVKNRNIKWILK